MSQNQLRIGGVGLLIIAWLAGSSSLAKPTQVNQAATALELVQTIPLKGKPGRLDHMALDAKGARLFIANLSNDSFDVVDLKGGKLVQQIPEQHYVQGVAFSPELNRIFVGNGKDGVCNVFDGQSYKLLASIKLPGSDNVRYDPRTQRVYVSQDNQTLSVLDAKSMQLKKTINLPGAPEGFQVDSKGGRLYVNVLSPARVAVVDTDKEEVAAVWPINVAEANYPMALDEANKRVIIGCRKPPMLVALKADSGKVVANVAIPEDTDDIFYDAKRKRIYSSCGEGVIAVISQKDANNYEVTETIPTAKLARTCLFDAESDRLFLLLPRQEGKDGPELRVYQARPAKLPK
jgi:DNA-binding beta-propeller fold protein YncE